MSNIYNLDENINDEDQINSNLTPAYIIIGFSVFGFVLSFVLLVLSIWVYMKEKNRLE